MGEQLLLGNDPPAFDVPYWNADSTRLPARFHSELLDLFKYNPLVEPRAVTVCGTPIDLGQVTKDSFVLAGTASYFEDAAKATVSYADLNLEREEDVRELYRRLQYASRKVCRDTSPMIGGSIVWRVCYRRTLSHAVDKFDNEDLARIHAR